MLRRITGTAVALLVSGCALIDGLSSDNGTIEVVGCEHNPNACLPNQALDAACVCLPSCTGGLEWVGGSGCMAALDSDPFDPGARANELTQAICSHASLCNRITFAEQFADMDECIRETLPGRMEQYQAVKLQIEARRTTFARAAFDRCLQSILGITTPDACMATDVDCTERFFVGQQAIGQACYRSEECATGSGCAGSLTDCGVCEALPTIGDECSDGCANGAQCAVDSDGDAFCVGTAAGEGAACDTLENALCPGQLQCAPSGGSFTCQRPLSFGATCDMQSTTTCNELDGDVCVGTTCSFVVTQAGAACTVETVCEGGYCDLGGTDICVRYPSVGSSCAAIGACEVGARCGSEDTCVARNAIGTRCTAHDQCAAGLTCIPGSDGFPICQPLGWKLCGG